MNTVTAHRVHLFFKGHFKPQHFQGQTYHNVTHFIWQEHGIEALFKPHYLPEGLSDHPIIKSTIKKPIITQVTHDLESIEEHIKTLEQLSIENQHHHLFSYEVKLGQYTIYDQSNNKAFRNPPQAFAHLVKEQNGQYFLQGPLERSTRVAIILYQHQKQKATF